jgi:hypothetical protein
MLRFPYERRIREVLLQHKAVLAKEVANGLVLVF